MPKKIGKSSSIQGRLRVLAVIIEKLAVFGLLAVCAGCAVEPIQPPPAVTEVLSRAEFSPIAQADSGALYKVDNTSLSRLGNEISAWVFTFPSSKEQLYSRAERLIIECDSYTYRAQSWWVGAWNSSLVEFDSRPVSSGTVLDVIRQKLCGLYIPAAQASAEFIYAGHQVQDYWFPTTAVRQLSDRNVVTFKGFSAACPGCLPNAAAIHSFRRYEFDCVSPRVRFGEELPWEDAVVKSSTPWISLGAGTLGSGFLRRLCADQRIEVVRQHLGTTAPDAGSAAEEGRTKGKDTAAEERLIAPQMSFDAAKKKCADIGFAVGTDKFGACVLQLTK